MPYRVIQWATGNVGRAAIEGILDHPELELVGCWVHSAAKSGRDVGEICGLAPIGVRATNDAAALLASDADCVLYSPLLADTQEVVRILESRKNVVTPLGWFYPFRSAGVADVEAACRRGGVTLHGTGIHPGGITERFPLMLSALSHRIEHVRAEEFSDIRTYAAEFVVREIMLFGKPPDVAAKSPMLDLLGAGFGQSIDMVAAALGFDLDPERVARHETAVATARIDTPIGTIESGTVAAQRFTWQGTVRGTPVVTARVNWLMGQQHLDPPWTFGPAGERFEVEITGDPPVKVAFHGLHPPDIETGIRRNSGIVATAMHCVNAIPYVCRAEAGIKTYLDLPLVSGRAAPELRKGA
ncbi:MAG TPA: dihydrodipicolinate reductase [Candidatus Binatia bacterium]|nr:dihydrodipicolinate reductase [Candidatus Binatia bacterium]